MGRFTLNRRTVLRGMLGGAAIAVALPPLEAMFDVNGTAYAGGETIPKRFGVFFWGNGVKKDRWNPSGTGADYPLSPALEPLAAVKDYVSVVSGMDIKTGNERGHHAGAVGILSGSPMISQDPMGAPYASTFSAPSIDQVVARAFAETSPTRFRSLEIGITQQVVRGEGTTLHYLSHNGPDNANPPIYSPRAVFDRIFGDGFTDPSTTPTIDPRLALRRSILDAVMSDARAIESRVSSTDRMRIQQHLESVRTLERQIELIETMPPPIDACMRPEAPGTFDSFDYRPISRTMSDLVAMALACDQTRVFSNMFSGGVSLAVYRALGAGENHHSLSHDEAGDQPMMQNITRYIMEEFAYQLEALRAIPVGDGNLLDHCAILASSDVADGRAHSIDDYPVLVAGRAGGRLRSGVHVRRLGDNTSKILLSILQALDLPFTQFGNRGGQVSETVSELMA
ncbi:DUF1552 domain-containing protein [Sandaracinus amylolyticus]|uniref:Tat (Twin-arginine translocation) pathway signal sequence domain protein n=1 Tax=Sandaracinus amylolyticus TaxID=927083 RepID=A0A0F6W909_9BACT|nr:DUF1552 domain-containing protein [Sandaracinus amylolyticus]AKF10550.1 hypothetical protein DB32_007699 [Sandaracinus amylolyticus]